LQKDWRTSENVAILQLLSVGALGKTLLQSTEGFRAQRVLACWAGGPTLGGGGGVGVGGSYNTLIVGTLRGARGIEGVHIV
jgi:hypothetical protein